MRILLKTAALATALALMASPSVAQNYPDKPIQLMVAYPAGGSTDVAARIVAAIAEKAIGQPIVVVNKSGAGGQVGWTEMVRQKPDGYYLGFINLPGMNTIVADPERQAIFNIDSFIPIINQVLDPGVIWVRAESPFKTYQDFADAAKKAPGTLRVSTTGILSDDHLAILMFEEATGTSVRLVHLEGGAAQMKETLAGNIDVSFDNVGSIVKQVKGGQVRALAVMDTERSKYLPDVPTTKEVGAATILSNSSRGIAAPKGTPPAVVKKLEETFKKAMDDPDHIKRLEEAGLGLKVMTGDEYAKYYKDLHTKAIKYTEWSKKRQQ
ncbi:MAG: Bug family tripartite tricarboxylate transporter substrate binding protein [Hyphomicrobiaceae bacterium]